jgi:hypothetical protein
MPQKSMSPDALDAEFSGFFSFSPTTQFQNIDNKPVLPGMPAMTGSAPDATWTWIFPRKGDGDRLC